MFSKIMRRTHMYLALFLGPWMLMYALSTSAMNHREFFRDYYGSEQVFEKEKEELYAGTFAPGAGRDEMARQILADLDLDGAFGVRGGAKGEPLIIHRADPITPRKITYTPGEGKLVVERLQFRTDSFLERLHRRRGYRHNYLLEDLWGFTVDLVIVSMLIWVLSGVWVWWGLKTARRWGLVCAAAGSGLFALFVLTI